MMKYASLIAAALIGSASAFAPSTTSRAVTSLNAEKSASLPWANRPKLVRAVQQSTHPNQILVEQKGSLTHFFLFSVPIAFLKSA